MRYDEIRIELAAERAGEIADWLTGQDLSFQQADETTLDPPPFGQVRFHLFVPPGDSQAVVQALREAIGQEPAISVHSRHEDEWHDAWKRHFHTRRIGRLALVPSWEVDAHRPEPGEVTLQLDPGRAFGTGGHASTRLCLRLLDDLAGQGPLGRVLDVGCGCGVLAIAALLYDPNARGLALDIDPEALEVTRDNAARNGVADRLAIEATALDAVGERFAVVLANLSAQTLQELARPLRARLAPGGRLVLGGLLSTEAAEVAAQFVALDLVLVAEEKEEEWSALLLADAPRGR
ncbi:MAG: 50S ribosomal protein L11 methyltransferase [Myxococcota bacterium]|nr:50S ribosomal protein L11 methyltransferase [Myxococcota bacterium]